MFVPRDPGTEIPAADNIPSCHRPYELTMTATGIRMRTADETAPHAPMVRRVRGCACHAATLPGRRTGGAGRRLGYTSLGPDLIRSPFRVVAVGTGHTGGILLFLPTLEDVIPGLRTGIASLLRRDAREWLHADVLRVSHQLAEAC